MLAYTVRLADARNGVVLEKFPSVVIPRAGEIVTRLNKSYVVERVAYVFECLDWVRPEVTLFVREN